MKGPQELRREKEYNLTESVDRTGAEFDGDNKYLHQIDAFKEENQFLRGLCNRLQTELKEYQIRFPVLLVDEEAANETKSSQLFGTADVTDTAVLDIAAVHSSVELAPWTSSSKYMSPLLVAYDARINQLKQQIADYQQSALQVKKESDLLIQRNIDLEEELETKLVALYKRLRIQNEHTQQLQTMTDGKATKATLDGSDANASNAEDATVHMSGGDDATMMMMDEYETSAYAQRIRILTQQNTLLRESEQRWSKEKENYLMVVNENNKNIDLLHKQLKKLSAANANAEQTMQHLQYENDALKEVQNELKEDVIKKLTQKSQYLEQQFTKEVTQHSELKIAYKEYEGEYQALHDVYSELQRKCKNMQQQSQDLQEKFDAINDELIECQTALSSKEKKLASTLESLGNIEGILQSYKKKEIEFLTEINNLKTENELFVNVEKAKLINEKNQCLQQIHKLRQQNKQILQELTEENQQRVRDLKAEHCHAEQSLNAQIKQLIAKKVQLAQEKNKYEQQYIVLQNDLANTKRVYLEKFETLHTSNNELKCKITESDLEKERFSEIAQRKTTELKQQQQRWQAERDVYKQSIAELNHNDDRKNLKLIENEEKMLELSETIARLTEKLRVNETRYTEQMESLTQKLTRNESAFKSGIESYKAELTNLESLYNDSQAKSKDIISKHETLSTQWKQENRNTLERFTNIVNELKQENKALMNRNVKLEAKMNKLLHNEESALCARDNIAKKMKEGQSSLQSLAETVDHLKSTNDNYKRKEMLLLTENKNLRSELNKVQISMQRLQRTHQLNQRLTDC